MMKTAVISGARGGVAQALAALLRTQGTRLALISRDVSGLGEHAASDVLIQADVATQEGAAQAFAAVREAFGGPAQGFAHCAGSTVIAPLSRTREEQYRGCMAANVDSAFFCTQAYLAQLTEAKQAGSMVLFSSVVAGMGVSNHAAIAAAKGAIEALTRALAADYAAAGIRINCVAPGLMRSPMTARMLSSEAAEKQIAAQYPLGFFGEASDGANAAAFLLGEQSRWITGQILHLDGGFSAIRPYVKS
jgi:NAD(P)-dependent dehydrogenase (short-subunit alcohol dehydrogenase family)